MAGSSGRYRILETPGFRRDLTGLPAGDRTRLERKLSELVYPALREEPHAEPKIRKLRDWSPETWRYRTGEWRCFYQIEEQEHLVILAAFHRRVERTYRR